MDIVLALKLAKQFGGSKVYIGKFNTVKRSVRTAASGVCDTTGNTGR